MTIPDTELLNNAIQGLRDFQTLASKYGIDDVFQDNGGKTLQITIHMGLKILPGIHGSDAVDDYGNNYEIKTFNDSKQELAYRKKIPICRLSHNILKRYRSCRWLIGVFDNIYLKELYYLHPKLLEPFFSKWQIILDENKPYEGRTIQLRFIKQHGTLVWKDGAKLKCLLTDIKP